MTVGTWVEFTSSVVKEVTANLRVSFVAQCYVAVDSVTYNRYMPMTTCILVPAVTEFIVEANRARVTFEIFEIPAEDIIFAMIVILVR